MTIVQKMIAGSGLAAILVAAALLNSVKDPIPESLLGNWVEAEEGFCPSDSGKHFGLIRVHPKAIDLEGLSCRPRSVGLADEGTGANIEMWCNSDGGSTVELTMYFTLTEPGFASVRTKTDLNHLNPPIRVTKCPEESSDGD